MVGIFKADKDKVNLKLTRGQAILVMMALDDYHSYAKRMIVNESEQDLEVVEDLISNALKTK